MRAIVGCRSRAAGPGCRNEGNQRDFAGAAGSDIGFSRLAAAAGAVALSVIFGVSHFVPMVLIFVSAGASAVLRRAIARLSDKNDFIQPLLRGDFSPVSIGALAVRSDLRYVAAPRRGLPMHGCWCQDRTFSTPRSTSSTARIHLGAPRLFYAVLIVVAISTGLLLGLALFWRLPASRPPGRTVPLWQDVIALALRSLATASFFSTPLNIAAPGRWQWACWPTRYGGLRSPYSVSASQRAQWSLARRWTDLTPVLAPTRTCRLRPSASPPSCR